MKIEEIYPLISEKTKCIINSNQPFKSGKILLFDYEEYSHVKTKEDCYIIFVKREKKSNEFEIAILHEFFHCLQYEENFPSISRIDGTYDKFTDELSSYVLDLDVGDRLSKYGYDRFVGYKEMIESYLSIFYYAKLTGDKSFLFNIDENLGLSEFLSYLNYFNFDSELKELIPLVKEYIPNVFDNYKIISKGLSLYSHNNKKGVYKIFKYIIKGLKLEDNVKIT